MTIVTQEYIEVDERGPGNARLIGTRIKVKHLVGAQQANGFSTEALCTQYPEVPRAKIYAALAYYYDHKEEIDQQMIADAQFADEMRAKNPNRMTREQMLARLSTADRERLTRESHDVDEMHRTVQTET